MDKTAELVSKLGEVYQKLYNLPQYSTNTSRECDDRFELIRKIISDYVGSDDWSNIKILDIGCANGYFCFKAKELGATVKGLEKGKNVYDLNLHINELNGFDVSFENTYFDLKYAQSIPDGEYDFIFLFSLIHHICYYQGFKEASEIMKTLSKKTKFLLTELAIKEENIFWANSLPQSPDDFLVSFNFTKKLSHFYTHLTKNVLRPFYICSNNFAYINNKYYKIDNTQKTSHEFEQNTHLGTRSFHFSDNLMIKNYRLGTKRDPINKAEFNNEVKIIETYRDKIKNLPKIIELERTDNNLIMARECVEGELLSTKIAENKPYDPYKIIYSTIKQLAEYEALGLYHRDVRTWNVVVKNDGDAVLIDYGSLLENKQEHLFNDLITFIFDVLYKFKPFIAGIVLPRRSNSLYPDTYKNLITFITCKSEKEQSYQQILNYLDNPESFDTDNLSVKIDSMTNNYDFIESFTTERLKHTLAYIQNVDVKHSQISNELTAAISKLSQDFEVMVKNVEGIIKNHHTNIEELIKKVDKLEKN